VNAGEVKDGFPEVFGKSYGVAQWENIVFPRFGQALLNMTCGDSKEI